MWVYAFQKQHPTLGVKSTQSAESSFRAFKHYVKLEFGLRTPKLHELIPIIRKVLDKRCKLRLLQADTKRIQIHHENKSFKEALDIASYQLNSGGMAIFYKQLELMEARKSHMKFENDIIIETFNGATTSSFTGQYQTNGIKCSCSSYRTTHFCRHILFYRMECNLPLFVKNMFHRMYLKNSDASEDNIVEDEEPHNEVDDIVEPLSPGTQSIMRETLLKNYKKPKNVKFNQAFDVAKVQSELLSQQTEKIFDINLKSSKNFLSLLRTGLPENLIRYLENPQEYVISPKESDKVFEFPSEREPSNNIKSSLPAGLEELPKVVQDKIGFDCVLKKIKGDRGCL